MDIKKNLVSLGKYHIKCRFNMSPIGICVHNTYNDASAENEIEYMISNDDSTSFHYAVDDKEVIQGIPENRNAFHAGDGSYGAGNSKYISVEICYSKSGGQRFIQAEKNAAVFIASKLKEYGWTVKDVRKHQDFARKYCPHRTLDMGWDRFLNMIQKELDKLNEEGKPMTKDEKAYVEKLEKRIKDLEDQNKVYHYWDEIKALGGDMYEALYAMYKAGFFKGSSAADLNISKIKLEALVVQARAFKAAGILKY
jgi:N-acetylmuramoyl-L-alanine amidase CwlA